MKKTVASLAICTLFAGTLLAVRAKTVAPPQDAEAQEVQQALAGIEKDVAEVEQALKKGKANYQHQKKLTEALRFLDFIMVEAKSTVDGSDGLERRIKELRERIAALHKELTEAISSTVGKDEESRMNIFSSLGSVKAKRSRKPAAVYACRIAPKAPAAGVCANQYAIAPSERPMFPQKEASNREGYAHLDENPFVPVADDPLSTFSIDVDTASYSNLRRMLNAGQKVIPKGAVRIEEMLNYFRYRYEDPGTEHPLGMDVETAACPWAPKHRLARVALQARTIDLEERKPSNLVFLIDSSGSMRSANKMELLKKAYGVLVDNLNEYDKVAIVAYAGSAGLVLPATTANNRLTLKFAVENLRAGGSTAGGAGIKLAYKTARENFIKDGNNRVILATDGDFNVGISSESDLVDLIKEEAKSGVFLTVLGFGSGNYQDSRMEALSNKGNGNYAYIDSMREARKVFLSDLTGTLYTVAKDVKFQIEFNPTYVDSYRLIGYENRQLADKDFTDDKKDAGEVGSGHQVTALYELVPAGVGDSDPVTANLRYQTKRGTVEKPELMQIKVRYKQPDGDKSTEFSDIVPLPKDWKDGLAFASATPNTRFAAAVGAFGTILRGSEHKGTADYDWIHKTAAAALENDPGGYRSEFCELVAKARDAKAGPEPEESKTKAESAPAAKAE